MHSCKQMTQIPYLAVHHVQQQGKGYQMNAYTWVGLKGFFSVIPKALMDAVYKFLWIDTGGKRDWSDGRLFGD